ncbi:MAG: Ribosomal RNA large subunit methyltransferase I [Alphaproteobacteria bacterium MarineAlpha11_Bin1]|nr:MAG: Ribosomal RNA large subunit methyltransferase I [Alphaproteobacteria bacterium MarineAlpha11_Bin1]|tara:strand:+ start:5695 stop:6915 length:1221 start_codon:yes stop_codon:yes gene_type:complete
MNGIETLQKATMENRPTISTLPGRHKRVYAGHPWIYSNEIDMTEDLKALPQGTIVTVKDAYERPLGTAMFNPRPLISARILDRDPGAVINTDWLSEKFSAAMELRDRMYNEPFYRLVHAEADGLPGLTVDRYSGIYVVQLNTAGMNQLAEEIVSALEEVSTPTSIVLQRVGAARRMEGLEDAPADVIGDLPSQARVLENGVEFLADLSAGQKTGWFYDHRENRARVASLASGRRVLDVYSYLGGFGLTAASSGAADVLCIDRSQSALTIAAQSAEAAGYGDICRFEKREAFGALERLGKNKERFDIVVADPPAFVKSKKDLKPGARGYRKLARLSTFLVEPGGILCVASCSHHMDLVSFSDNVNRGIRDAGRSGRIIHTGGAGPDHPAHPSLPESAYLKCLFIQVD